MRRWCGDAFIVCHGVATSHIGAPCMVPTAPLKRRCRGGGTTLLSAGMRRTDIARDPPPTSLTSMRNLAAPQGDRRLGRKATRVGVHPDGSTLTPEAMAMQSILDLGADVDSRFV